MAKSTTLRAKVTNEILYPQTKAEVVYTLDGTTVETKIQNINNALTELDNAKDYKGYYPNETALLKRWSNSTEENPLTQEQSLERAGWYARVGDTGTSDTTMYYWDVEDKAWVKGATVEVTGASSVNGVQPNEQGDITLTAEDIPTAFTTSTGENKSVQEVINDLQGEHLDLESEIEKVDNKSTVLYLTNEQMVEAISSLQLLERYNNGQVVVCNNDGDYKLGSSYKYTIGGTEDEPTFSWEEITASGSDTESSINLKKDIYSPEIKGTVTYENVGPTNFVLDSDGYYENEVKNQYSVSVMKIYFNLEEPTDISFISTSSTTSSSINIYSQFSDIDVQLGNNVYNSDKVFADVSYASDIITTYKNFPAGEHFITVRMYRGYNTGEGVFKFKLLTKIPSDEEFQKEVNCVISVNDYGKLTANSEEVITDNDICFIVGTAENPISIQELPVGKYKIKGYFKYFRQQGVPNEILNDAVLDITVNMYSGTGNQKYITIYNGMMSYYNSYSNGYSAVGVSLEAIPKYKSRFDLVADNTHTYWKYQNYKENETSIQLSYFNPTSVFLGNVDQSITKHKALSTTNGTAYKPTGDYNPATKKYVDDSVSANKPIKSYDSLPESAEDNIFLNLKELSDNRLFYSKVVGNKNVLGSADWGAVFPEHLVILKSLLTSGILEENTTQTAIELQTRFKAGQSSYNQTTNIMANLNIIYLSGFYNTPMYTSESGWVDDGLNDDEFFDFTQFVINNKETFFSNYSNVSSWEYVEMYVSYSAGDKANYFKKLIIEPITENIRVALYDDLSNSGGSSEVPEEVIKYYEEYNSTKTYSKNDVIYYANHFFISVSDNNIGITPNVDAFYTMSGDNLYWRNMGYSATFATNATNDGDGNNIATTYATKAEAGIPTLTSPVRIWDLADGVYKLPTNCSIQYNGETNTGSFNIGSRVSGILTLSSSNITTLQSPNAYEKNIFWEISYGDNQYVTSKIIGRTTSTRGYYNKLTTGKLVGNITSAMAVPMCNDQQTMSTSSNFWLMGTPEQYSFSNVQHSSSCYIKSNELYSNNSKVATQNDLGDQVTYTLSGTTLTITSK